MVGWLMMLHLCDATGCNSLASCSQPTINTKHFVGVQIGLYLGIATGSTHSRYIIMENADSFSLISAQQEPHNHSFS